MKNTSDVMLNAYESLSPTTSKISQEKTGTHWGFNAWLRREGGIGLQVLGNCACLGPDPNGLRINRRFEGGFAEYSLHNADIQAQRTSLYAGLGYLARMALE